MHITSTLLVDLALLTHALDRPEVDIGETLHQLGVGVRLAVPTYLGLSLTTAGAAPFSLTALEDRATTGAVRSSLLVPLPTAGTTAGAALILYGSRAGAFVDLAADLSWLTGDALSDYSFPISTSPPSPRPRSPRPPPGTRSTRPR